MQFLIFKNIFSIYFNFAYWTHALIYLSNPPVSNYASVPTNNNLKSRLVRAIYMLSCAIHLLYFLAQLGINLDFGLLFVGTEA